MSIPIGFETIGNATIIVHDVEPVLVTDPWVRGSAYFGSWTLTHEIPEEQLRHIMAAKYVWFSHGHPDHLNPESIELFKGKKILLPDHYGGRILRDLTEQGLEATVLPDRKWVPISPRVKVYCIADYFQDAVMLIDIDGKLIVNLNDAHDHGWLDEVRSIISKYEESFLLALQGYGDADMINLFNEDGSRILPTAAQRFPVGESMARKAEALGVTHVTPSSSLHRYQREDSAWTNDYITKAEDYLRGFNSKTVKFLPAFIQYRCDDDSFRQIEPNEIPSKIYKPEEFGDNWTEVLGEKDIALIADYFKNIAHLAKHLDFIQLKVGGRENTISLGSGQHQRGLIFEVPRNSLMTSIQYKIFDDLLIGNFMKTTFVGRWSKSGLYPDFTPYVSKYADNGGARTEAELADYFKHYRQRSSFAFFRHRIEGASKNLFRSYVPESGKVYQLAKKIYWQIRPYL